MAVGGGGRCGWCGGGGGGGVVDEYYNTGTCKPITSKKRSVSFDPARHCSHPSKKNTKEKDLTLHHEYNQHGSSRQISRTAGVQESGGG